MTRHRVVTTRRADEDIEGAVEYYLHANAHSAALGFVDALEYVTDILAEHPSIGSSRFAIVTSIAEVRSLPLRRFPYVVVYTDDSDAVRVHRVLHTSRDIPAELAEL